MRSKHLAAALIVSILALGTLTAAQDGRGNPTIVGVWKITQVTTTGSNARTNTNPQPSIRIFTARHFSVTDVTAEKPRPDLPPPDKRTDKQIRDVIEGFQARAGTYELKGNELVYQLSVTMVPNYMKAGVTLTSTVRFEGNNTVYLTSKTDPNGPVANPSTIKLTRIE